MCYAHFIFPGNLELEALDSKALGLQATHPVCRRFSQTVFTLRRSHLAEPQFRHHV